MSAHPHVRALPVLHLAKVVEAVLNARPMWACAPAATRTLSVPLLRSELVLVTHPSYRLGGSGGGRRPGRGSLPSTATAVRKAIARSSSTESRRGHGIDSRDHRGQAIASPPREHTAAAHGRVESACGPSPRAIGLSSLPIGLIYRVAAPTSGHLRFIETLRKADESASRTGLRDLAVSHAADGRGCPLEKRGGHRRRGCQRSESDEPCGGSRGGGDHARGPQRRRTPQWGMGASAPH
jgi:hypothetical protein